MKPIKILLDTLSRINPVIPRVESGVIVNVVGNFRAPDKWDDLSFVERYFHYYTIPLLEGLGLTNEDKYEDALFWGSVQVCLGLHLRYMDYLLDEDQPALGNAYIACRSGHYLFAAQQLLSERDLRWGEPQWVQYRQFFAFEAEVAAGYVHGPESLWRRVSPLCVVGDTYCRLQLGTAFVRTYHRFLAWCLLKADYYDWLKDLVANKRTGVTCMMIQGGKYPTDSQITRTLERVGEVIEIEHRELNNSICSDRYPIWRAVLRFLAEVPDSLTPTKN